jgi:hypothetical protein
MPQKRLPPSNSMVQWRVAENDDDASVFIGCEIGRHIVVEGRAAIMMWIVTLLCAVICYEKYSRCKRRAVSVVKKNVATQTDDEVVMYGQTMETIRDQARDYDLATAGTKEELICRVIRHRHRGMELHC